MSDSDERMRKGFAELSATLRAGLVEDPDRAERTNAEARQREQARVRAEYLHYGLEPPSDLALSVTARRELGIGIATQEAAE